MFKMTPRIMRFILNIYGPYLGAGVQVLRISSDWREIDVAMKLRWYNRNAVGVHFGGSLYAMTDPHLMLMMMQVLGKSYTVWDKAAEIDFVRPGRGRVTASFSLTDADFADVIENTEDGRAYYPKFDVDVRDANGELVARVKKTLYVRKKKA